MFDSSSGSRALTGILTGRDARARSSRTPSVSVTLFVWFLLFHGASFRSLAQGTPAASPSGASEATIARLAGLCRVWGNAKYFHPAMADRPDLDWDAAVVAAIPRVRAARNAAEYRTAVQSMLDTLEDPVTRVVEPSSSAEPDPDSPREFGYRWVDDKVLVITAGNYYMLTSPPASQRLTEAAALVPTARAVVLDLRSSTAVDPYGQLMLTGAFAAIERLVSASPIQTAANRRRVYYGYESPGPFDAGIYRTGLFTKSSATLRPASDARDVPCVFVLNEHAAAIASTVPLQAAGLAQIVYEGDLRNTACAEFATVELADGLVAHVRQSESVLPDGRSGELAPDVIVPSATSGDSDAAMGAARALARDFKPSRVQRETLPASTATLRERSYPDMRYPSPEYRLLAAFRVWNAIEYFSPYKDLLDRAWAEALTEAIPHFEAARDAREYGLAVAALAVRIQDSHAYVSGRVFDDEIVGNGYPPIRVRMIENTPVVTAIFDADAARRAGVEVGDVVVAVDGRAASERLEESARLISASTPQSNADKATLVFMNGPVGSKVTLTLRDGTGREKQAALERRREDYLSLYHRERQGDVVRILPSNIGYVDLDRLAFDEVDAMFERLKGTRAIVFDMRGYPNNTFFAIAPRLTRETRVAALIDTPLVGHGGMTPAFESSVQMIEPTPGELYPGRTVMLVDERSMSQAEHTGLYLKAANGTTFVGSRTSGADGQITSIAVPGGIAVGFTGQRVRFPDGRQLQRIGLIPDVEVKPTIAGIRDGRDEVLEAALRFLSGD